MTTPLVSVVMPVRDEAVYVEGAVRSVLAQTLADLELVVVDDGSTDATPGILARLAGKDPRVRSLRLEGVGITPALNAGLDAARGEFIARTDADDLCLPHRLEHQLALLRQRQELCAVGSLYLVIDPLGRILGPIPCETEPDRVERDLLAGGIGVPHPTLLARRSAIDAVGGYDESYPVAQDKRLLLRLLDAGRLANVPDHLLLRREHPGSIGARRPDEQWRLHRRALQEAREARGLPWDGSILPTPPSPELPAIRLARWSRLAARHASRRLALAYAARAIGAAPLRWKPWASLPVTAALACRPRPAPARPAPLTGDPR